MPTVNQRPKERKLESNLGRNKLKLDGYMSVNPENLFHRERD